MKRKRRGPRMEERECAYCGDTLAAGDRQFDCPNCNRDCCYACAPRGPGHDCPDCEGSSLEECRRAVRAPTIQGLVIIVRDMAEQPEATRVGEGRWYALRTATFTSRLGGPIQ